MSSTIENGSSIAATPSGAIVDAHADIVETERRIVDAERDTVVAGASPADNTNGSSRTITSAADDISSSSGAGLAVAVEDSVLSGSAEDSYGFHTPPTTFTMNNTNMNGLRNGTVQHNGTAGPGTNASAQAVLQRGLEVLKEAEVDNSIEEIKKLDSQIDHFNNYLDKFEARNKALNEKLNNILETQKEERLKRRASFQQKEAEYKEQNEALEDQMRALLNRCHQARRISAAPDVSLDADGGHVVDGNGQSNGSVADHVNQL